MKKLLSILVLSLLLGCSENEPKEEKTYKSKYDVLDVSKFKELETNIRPMGILSYTYSSVVTQQDICDIYENTLNESKSKELLKEFWTSQFEECKFKRKLYEEVISNFKSINSTNANTYFYFKYSDEFSETSLFNILGIFSNLNECNKFKEEFLDKEIGLTSKCKNIEFLS